MGANVPTIPQLRCGAVVLVPCSPTTTERGLPVVGVASGPASTDSESCQHPLVSCIIAPWVSPEKGHRVGDHQGFPESLPGAPVVEFLRDG